MGTSKRRPGWLRRSRAAALLLIAVLLAATPARADSAEADPIELQLDVKINGIPFGLMGAFFNAVFSDYRTMLSGAAYNLGRILAGSAPWLVGLLGLHQGGHYFLFTAALGLLIAAVAALILRRAPGWASGLARMKQELG